MKNELKNLIKPQLTQLEDVARDKQRVAVRQAQCVNQLGHNGCWNCSLNDDRCTVNQTQEMLEARTNLIYRNITMKVIEWVSDVG